MSFFDSYRILSTYRRDPIGFLENEFKTHGDFIHLNVFGKNLFVVSNPDLVIEVLKSKNQFYSKGRTTKMLRKFLGSGLITNDEMTKWRKQHRLIRPMMNPKSIINLAPQMNHVVSDFMKDLALRSEINAFKEMNRLTWRIILKTLFSEEPTPEMDLWLEDILELMEIITRKTRSLIPIPFWIPTKDHRNLKRILEKFNQYVFSLIKERRLRKIKKNDLIQLLIDAKDEDLEMSDFEIRDEVMTFLMAGHETITNTMSWLLIESAKNPEIKEFIQDEVSDFIFTKDYQKLFDARNLGSVIDEVMRMWPSVWVFMRQADSDHQIGQIDVAKGSNVVLAPFLSHRSSLLWDEPEVFKVDRFLDKKKIHPGAFYPFGAGPRACIGMHFAYMEAKIIFSHFVNSFNWEIKNPIEQEWVAGITLRPKNNIQMLLEKRERNEDSRKR